MPRQNTNGTAANPPLVVGTVHSGGSLARALRLKPGAVDVLELRVDHFARDPDPLLRAAPKLAAPLIVTVRHPSEGGANGLSATERVALFQKFLPLAAYVDVELRSVVRLAAVLAAARQNRVRLIVSDHHFRKTPSVRVLRERLQLARAAGADIVKVAGVAESASALERLIALLEDRESPLRSVMGMGPLGKVSRLLCARLGSVLNYGYLDQAQVPGQWEATVLKQRIAELWAEA